jgi:2'-5' RNA ligase
VNTKKLFFALWPDDRQRDQLRNAISPVAKEIEGTAVFRGSWHVTLAYIGDYPERQIPGLQAATRLIQVEPFRLRFDRAEFWPRPKIAVLAAQTVPPELARLVESLNLVLAEEGIDADNRLFRPHITIVKRARTFETLRLAQATMSEWSGFELVESISAPGGATYHPLKQ